VGAAVDVCPGWLLGVVLRARAQRPGRVRLRALTGISLSGSLHMSTSSIDLESSIDPFIGLGLVSEVFETIKSGKEATVYRCRGTPASGHQELALKVYRPRARRSFKNDAAYREGGLLDRMGGGNTRAARALRGGTRFGRQVQEATWTAREWEVLQRLHEAGLGVPRPVHATDRAILMELCVDTAGGVARPLAATRLSPAASLALFDAVCTDVERMLWLDVLHADLSPFNILWDGERYRIIDFSQLLLGWVSARAGRLLDRGGAPFPDGPRSRAGRRRARSPPTGAARPPQQWVNP
jgi:RIO kinase 1